MISKIAGTLSIKSTQIKMIKIAIALILSNIFFFLLFSGNEKKENHEINSQGLVEVSIQAVLLTPFQNGKKILLIQKSGGHKLIGMLKDGPDNEGRLTILINESEAQTIFQYERWEILPFISDFKLATKSNKGDGHEIRY